LKAVRTDALGRELALFPRCGLVEALNRVLEAQAGVLTFEGREARLGPRCRARSIQSPPAGNAAARVRLVACECGGYGEFPVLGKNPLGTFKAVSGRGSPLTVMPPSQGAPHLGQSGAWPAREGKAGPALTSPLAKCRQKAETPHPQNQKPAHGLLSLASIWPHHLNVWLAGCARMTSRPGGCLAREPSSQARDTAPAWRDWRGRVG